MFLVSVAVEFEKWEFETAAVFITQLHDLGSAGFVKENLEMPVS